MGFIRRAVLVIVVVGIVALGIGWFIAGREQGPSITITSPAKFVGRAGTMDVTVDSPTAITAVSAQLEQNGQSATVASYTNSGAPQTRVELQVRLARPRNPRWSTGQRAWW